MRLFVAIQLPEVIKDTLTAMCGGVDDAHWQERGQLHLTLRFIGEVDGAVAHDIDDVLYQISAPAFSLILRRTGFFNKRNLTAIGLEPERHRYHPHVTLARLSGLDPMEAEGYAARYGEYASPPFIVDRFCLFSSQLSRGGAIHTLEAEYLLAQED